MSSSGAVTLRSKRRVAYRRIVKNRFLRLAEIEYQDGPVRRTWELTQRTSHDEALSEPQENSDAPVKLPIDAVDVRALITPLPGKGCGEGEEEEEKIIVIAQYRPPIDSICLEFPAGLVDEGENPLQAALRELHEETGYVAVADDVLDVSPVLCYEPGMSDSCFHFVTVKIDANRPGNETPTPHLDDMEDIAVHLVPHGSEMVDGLRRLCDFYANGGGRRCIIDAKLYTYACALQLLPRLSTSLK